MVALRCDAAPKADLCASCSEKPTPEDREADQSTELMMLEARDIRNQFSEETRKVRNVVAFTSAAVLVAIFGFVDAAQADKPIGSLHCGGTQAHPCTRKLRANSPLK